MMTEEQISRIEKFKSDNKPRVPAYAHREEIKELKSGGYSIAQIKSYLKENYSIKTSDRTLSRIINDSKNTKTNVAHNEEPKTQKAKNFFTKNKG